MNMQRYVVTSQGPHDTETYPPRERRGNLFPHAEADEQIALVALAKLQKNKKAQYEK
jgi:hypothetical protein